MKMLAIYLLLVTIQSNPKVWFGTSPSCEGNWYKCEPFDMILRKIDRYGDGKMCWTGAKALCELKDGPKVPPPQLASQPLTEVNLNLMSYNVFERPWVATHDGQVERTCRIPRAIAMSLPDMDVIALQENFMYGCDSQMDFQKLFAFYGWPYITKVVGDTYKINGGARLVSKYPLKDARYHVYKNSAFGTADYYAGKGFVYAKIEKQGRNFHIIGTHLQAQECETCDSVRYAQVGEIKTFLDSMIIAKDEPVILLGDLNLDNILESHKVTKMMDILNFSDLKNNGKLKYSYDRSKNDVVEPGEKPLWLDYIALSNDHKLHETSDYKFEAYHIKTDEPFQYCNTAPLSPYWIYRKSGLCRTEKTTSNLSDHFPVYAHLKFKWN